MLVGTLGILLAISRRYPTRAPSARRRVGFISEYSPRYICPAFDWRARLFLPGRLSSRFFVRSRVPSRTYVRRYVRARVHMYPRGLHRGGVTYGRDGVAIRPKSIGQSIKGWRIDIVRDDDKFSAIRRVDDKWPAALDTSPCTRTMGTSDCASRQLRFLLIPGLDADHRTKAPLGDRLFSSANCRSARS